MYKIFNFDLGDIIRHKEFNDYYLITEIKTSVSYYGYELMIIHANSPGYYSFIGNDMEEGFEVMA
jgi:hypothetical protein